MGRPPKPPIPEVHAHSILLVVAQQCALQEDGAELHAQIAALQLRVEELEIWTLNGIQWMI